MKREETLLLTRHDVAFFSPIRRLVGPEVTRSKITVIMSDR